MLDNAMRVSGLVSNMDIDKMVDKLMKAERMPLNDLKQDQKILKWRRDDYRDMNKILDHLDRSISDGIAKEGVFSAKNVTSTNPDAVSAIASGARGNTTTEMTVSQLAAAANGSSGSITADEAFDPDASLASQKDMLKGSDFGSQFTLKVFQSDGTTASKDIQIDASSDSLNDILQKINDSGLGVTAFYEESVNKIAISSDHTGNNQQGAEITVDEGDGKLFSEVFQFGTSDADGQVTVADNGQNARFTLNGLADMERTSNTFTVNDMTYTLKKTTSSPVSLTTSTDTDKIYDSVTSFVDNYNKVIASINDKISEERYRDYPPLTDKQREELSDHEIELWNEKSKSGMLRGDAILSSGLNQMRTDLYDKVEGDDVADDVNQLSQIGIVTSSNYQDNGKLVIEDSEKLRRAIKDHPQTVSALFTQQGDTTEAKGIAERLSDTISDTMTRIENKAGNAYDTTENYRMGRQLNRNETRIDDFNDRLTNLEDRYYRQFTRMEQAIQKANQQSAYITNAFSQGGS